MRHRHLFALLFAASVQAGPVAVRADAPEVDLALVLAVDISYSMDEAEQRLQREGFIEAFLSPVVQKAIADGFLGRIAVTYVEWAGADTQHVVVPWTVIDDSKSSAAFAARLASRPISRGPYTSISGAIAFGVELLDRAGVETTRRVIDISGDGVGNHGPLVTRARDEAVSRGVTINGLPIMLMRQIGEEVEHLDSYYKDCVIGGFGAFVIPVREPGEMVAAIKAKMILEIAGLTIEPQVDKAQAEARIDCVTGHPEVVGWMHN
jgi:Protein of unknown function (DUF1194)